MVAVKKKAPKAKGNVAMKDVATGNKPKKGLRESQIRMLRVLVREQRALSKNELIDLANVATSDMTKYLGSEDPVVRQRNDERWFPSLITLKYVKGVRDKTEDKVVGYEVTAAGKQAVTKIDKTAAKTHSTTSASNS